MTAHLNLITELEFAISHGTASRRAQILLHLTDLFIRGSDRFSVSEIELFDDVFIRLVREIEVSARTVLAHHLAPNPRAPFKITRMLACDDEIKVAHPILAHSERLDDVILLQTAQTKGQEYLLAISQRKSLNEIVTDVLVERGDKQVVLSTAVNPGAKFSEAGFSTLVRRSDGDDVLAASIGLRQDIPPHIFQILLASASELVRTRLLAENPQARTQIHSAVAMAVNNVQNNANVGLPSNAETEDVAEQPQLSGEINDDTIRTLAEAGRIEEATAALSRMCSLSVNITKKAMIQNRLEAVLVLARAAKLSWSTTKVLLSLCAGQRGISSGEIERSLASFERLKVSTALQIIEFYKIRQATGRSRSV